MYSNVILMEIVVELDIYLFYSISEKKYIYINLKLKFSELFCFFFLFQNLSLS